MTLSERERKAERALIDSYGKAWERIRLQIVALLKLEKPDRAFITSVAQRITEEIRPLFRSAAQVVISAQSESVESAQGDASTIGNALDGRTLMETMDAIGFSLVESVKKELTTAVKAKWPQEKTVKAVRAFFTAALKQAITVMQMEVTLAEENAIPFDAMQRNPDRSRYRAAAQVLRGTPESRAYMERVRAKYGRNAAERAKSLEAWFGPDDLKDINE